MPPAWRSIRKACCTRPAVMKGSSIRFRPAGNMAVYVEGMGVATGIVFDQDGNLYVGDRSGTVFKISRNRQIYVFATLEPSIAAYHLAFGPDDYLYVTGPTTSSFDSVHRISRDGHVETFLSRTGPPARDGVRCQWKSVRRGIARRTARRGADRARRRRLSCSSPARKSSASRSRHRNRWSWPPTIPSIAVDVGVRRIGAIA